MSTSLTYARCDKTSEKYSQIWSLLCTCVYPYCRLEVEMLDLVNHGVQKPHTLSQTGCLAHELGTWRCTACGVLIISFRVVFGLETLVDNGMLYKVHICTICVSGGTACSSCWCVREM